MLSLQLLATQATIKRIPSSSISLLSREASSEASFSGPIQTLKRKMINSRFQTSGSALAGDMVPMISWILMALYAQGSKCQEMISS